MQGGRGGLCLVLSYLGNKGKNAYLLWDMRPNLNYEFFWMMRREAERGMLYTIHLYIISSMLKGYYLFIYFSNTSLSWDTTNESLLKNDF